jgi:tetratricopeptide (TPR) repeat protein
LQAECHFALGNFPAARQSIDQALAANADFVPALTLDGKLLLQEGRVTDAIKTLRRLIQVQPTDHAAHQMLATALGRIGQEDEAKKHVELAQKLQKKWEEFSTTHTRAIQEPWNGTLRYRLGILATELDRPDLADTWFRAALAIDPANAAAAKALEGSK